MEELDSLYYHDWSLRTPVIIASIWFAPLGKFEGRALVYVIRQVRRGRTYPLDKHSFYKIRIIRRRKSKINPSIQSIH